VSLYRLIRKYSPFLLVISSLGSSFAYSQNDFSGQWRPVMDEDRDERIPGPWGGEYFGYRLMMPHLRGQNYGPHRYRP
jgi:hypothetical protein